MDPIAFARTDPERKPPAKVETELREPWTLRFTASERREITEAAAHFEPTVCARDCAMLGLKLRQEWPALEASLRTTASILERLRPWYEAAQRGAA